jgi:hypothetical protein
METIAVFVLLVYLVISAIGMIIGIDLKKWSSWLFGIYGFLSGFLVGFLLVDLKSGLLGGLLFAFIVLYGGAMVRWQRERFK